MPTDQALFDEERSMVTMSFGDHIEKLDKFYSDSANLDVPVIDAMREVRSH